jgi:small subunit ribosomal protein S20
MGVKLVSNSPQAKKRVRQNEKRRVHNKSIKSECNTIKKKILNALESKNTEEAKQFFTDYQSKVDRAARKNIVSKNSAARNKSNLTKRIKELG